MIFLPLFIFKKKNFNFQKILTPCFIKAVYICHIALFPSNLLYYEDATMTFNLSVKNRLKIQHVNMNRFHGVVVIIERKAKHGVTLSRSIK